MGDVCCILKRVGTLAVCRPPNLHYTHFGNGTLILLQRKHLPPHPPTYSSCLVFAFYLLGGGGGKSMGAGGPGLANPHGNGDSCPGMRIQLKSLPAHESQFQGCLSWGRKTPPPRGCETEGMSTEFANVEPHREERGQETEEPKPPYIFGSKESSSIICGQFYAWYFKCIGQYISFCPMPDGAKFSIIHGLQSPG